MSWQELWSKTWVRAIVLAFTLVWLLLLLSRFQHSAPVVPEQVDPLMRWSSTFAQLAEGTTGFWSSYYRLLAGIQGISADRPMPPIPNAQHVATLWLLIFLSVPVQIYVCRKILLRTQPSGPVEESQNWSPWAAWACYLASDGISLGGVFLSIPLLKLMPTNWQNVSLQCIYMGGSLLWYVLLRSRLSRPQPTVELLANILLGFQGFCAILVGSFSISLILNCLGLDGQSTNPIIAQLACAGPGLLAAWMLAVVMLGPLREEIWYRSVLSPALGLVPAAMVFAMIHADPHVMLQLVWTGIVLGLVYRHGGLLSSWVAHGLWNLQVFLMIVWAVS